MTRLGNVDILQEMLEGIVNDAYDMIDHPAQNLTGRSDHGELIEDRGHFTFILQVSGRRSEDLSVLVRKGELEIRAPGLALQKRIPADADPNGFERSLRNGVLSVRINKL